MDNKDLCEHTRIRLIAAAIGHQQCTMTAASLVPLADGRVVAIGTPADVARLLPATTAAQPLDLDRLQVLADILYKRDSFAISAELNEMIAQARAAQPAGAADTTASASEGFSKCKHCDAITHPSNPEEVCPGCQDVLIPRTAQAVEAIEVAKHYATLRETLERIAAPADAGCGCSFPCRCKTPEAEAINAESMRDEAAAALKNTPEVATLAPVAAQQAAAKAPAVQAVDAPDARAPGPSIDTQASFVRWLMQLILSGQSDAAKLAEIKEGTRSYERRWRLFDKPAQRHAARTASPASAPEASQRVAENLAGRKLSVDVSTGDDDAGNRIFAELTGETGSDGKTLIAIETSRNFVSQQAGAPAAQLIEAAQAFVKYAEDCDEDCIELDNLKAALASQQAAAVVAPSGYKLVPLVDTNAMMTAAYAACDAAGERVSSAAISRIYQAAVAAAPATAVAATKHEVKISEDVQSSTDARDAARLDFLEQLAERKDESMPNVRAFGKTFVAETLREAIDAAMRATQQEGGR